MQFALVNGSKHLPSPKLSGLCMHCGAEMIAKCGKVVVWHWAHKSKLVCDPWWENETEWHRKWKNQFPTEWQEISHIDAATKERHIADVKTDAGLIVEFQHSVLKDDERDARETFYRNIVWVVDGNRGQLDKANFNLSIYGAVQKDPLVVKIRWWARSHLLHNWSQSKAQVFIDFGDDHIWRLVEYDRATKEGFVAPIEKEEFIQRCKRWANWIDSTVTKFEWKNISKISQGSNPIRSQSFNGEL